MQKALFLGLALLLSLSSFAQDLSKKEQKLLLGTWRLVSMGGQPAREMDNNKALVLEKGGKGRIINEVAFTWRLEGRRLLLTETKRSQRDIAFSDIQITKDTLKMNRGLGQTEGPMDNIQFVFCRAKKHEIPKETKSLDPTPSPRGKAKTKPAKKLSKQQEAWLLQTWALQKINGQGVSEEDAQAHLLLQADGKGLVLPDNEISWSLGQSQGLNTLTISTFGREEVFVIQDVKADVLLLKRLDDEDLLEFKALP
jgi:hypothetical protein